MDALNLAALLISLAAVFAWINHRFIRLPSTIGLMLIALVFSLVLVLAGALGFGSVADKAQSLLAGIDFNTTLLHGMLSFLLFAGALHVNLADLAKQKWVIAVLASVGVIISTAIVGGLAWLAFSALGLDVPFIYCLVFGALISPTDPIAVLGLLKTTGAPKTLETKITGESLFNDGIGVVVFLVLLGIATRGDMTASEVALLFVEEAVGGVVFGLLSGGIAYGMLRKVDNYQVEVLITLALVMGGYALATAIHVSGPIAVVVAGLLIGNQGRLLAMSDTTREHLDSFWELLDEILNAVLFVLIGLELLVLSFSGEYLLAAALAIPIVLLARLVSVGLPIGLMRKSRQFSPWVVTLMTWGGLRGGISVALALSLPSGPERDLILAVTYVLVVFSILVQGLTLGPLLRRLLR
ncbi:MAG: sodium:proton antiporter [Gammaproteobacteria bacterium HGW-Gammaproteobacteria-1]|jgi:CPA1 family monovalent cation:H+ antiporter|nr:MAG: sodium:proton antiporter [Gammaproteobacteria bacterium HGW-Gammaproteobacteria-1]